jgi:hypothetical protein
LYIGLPSLRVAKIVTFSPPVAVAVPTLFTATEQSPLASTSLLAGQLIVGAFEAALTVTLNWQLSPVVSDTVTVVTPCGKKQSLQ